MNTTNKVRNFYQRPKYTENTSIDVYLMNTYFRHHLKTIDDTFMHIYLKHVTGCFLDEQDALNILKQRPPSNKHLVHRLSQMGVSQKDISVYLNISQPAISYHLKHPPKRHYVNPFLKYFYDRGAENTILHVSL